jgi:mannose-6-phosphate isomerase-like protein (cupin superfamily)
MEAFPSSIGSEGVMRTFDIDRDREVRFSDEKASLTIRSCSGNTRLPEGASHFVVAFRADLDVVSSIGREPLRADCFGVFTGPATIEGGGRALIVSVDDYACPRLMGGPVEDVGRLRYVDGCSATILLAPPIKGEPCLNFMHLPANIAQTMHTHESVRVGLILSGEGICETPRETFAFRPGTVFLIPPNTQHSFQSPKGTLRIVIFHPDSDTGPTHDDHTMLNNTFIAGVSAREMEDIRTMEI